MRVLLIVLLVVVASVGGWMLFSPMRGEAGGVGVNTLVENDVTTASAGQDAWTPAVLGGDVYFGDRIVTAADSRLEVRLLDRSNLSVGANARLTIDRFVYDPSNNAAGALVSVLTGAFRYASDEGKPEQVSFRTPGATIGIRGTVIEGVVGPEAVALIAGMTGAPDLSLDADSAAVIILRSGAADVRAGGQTVVLDQPGQAVILTRRQIYPTFAVTPETTERFDALLPPTAAPTGPSGPPPGTPPTEAPKPLNPTPTVTPPPVTTPPTRLPPRDPGVRPPRPNSPQTRPTPGALGPAGPQRTGPAGPIAGQPAPGGQDTPQVQPQAGQPQAQPQGAQQPPAGSQPGTQTPPATTAPGTAPTAAPSTTKPTDGTAQPQNGQTQPAPTQPNGDRPTVGQPTTTPPGTRPTQPSGTRPAQPQTQPRTQPVAPGGGVAGPRRN
jgi:hypothetical protein